MIVKGKWLVFVFVVLFLIVSCAFISPALKTTRSQYHSSQLEKVSTSEGNTKRTDYVDSDGRITIAADMGFATIIETKISENCKLEQYYDDKGKPISRYNGYYAVRLDYDEKGNNTRITYLNIDSKPMITVNGYAIEEREYSEAKRLISVKYYGTEGEPILTPLYGHGEINEYNTNGKISKITYIDINGVPVLTKKGYAIICRNYYVSEGPENGKVESEFYFDGECNPVNLSLGEYGIHKKYDDLGRNNVLTYLDADGNPMVTNKGYTSVVRTFQANNSVLTEQYLDIDGNPFPLAEGQYGFMNSNGWVVYLDENGNEQFNIKNLLYNRSNIIIVIAVILVLMASAFSRNWNIVFAILYFVAIVYLTLMFRENNGATLKLEPFWSYRRILIDSEARADILKNIWLFIPFGAILYRIYPNGRMILIPLVLSILIEVIQYFAGTGFCELDDVISNTLGGFIGFEMGKMIIGLKSQLGNKYRRMYNR